MDFILFRYTINLLWIFLLLGGCATNINVRPLYQLNDIISQSSSSYREPSLGNEWLVRLTRNNGREKVQLVDLRSKRVVPLPGINRFDAQPISVSVNANGTILAVIHQRDDKTELIVYRRNIGSIQRILLEPRGIPRRVSIDGAGRVLAVQVSRDGKWDLDLIRL